MRLFIALPIPESLRAVLASWQQQYASGIRIVPPENLHVTLAFFGDVPERMVEKLASALASVCRAHAAFTLTSTSIVPAPRNRPGMYWLVFMESRAFTAFAKRLHSAALPFTTKPDRTPPSAHVTLARFPEGRKGGEGAVQPLRATIRATSCALIASHLTHRGSVFTTLRRFPLAPP